MGLAIKPQVALGQATNLPLLADLVPSFDVSLPMEEISSCGVAWRVRPRELQSFFVQLLDNR